jgi:mercuric ion binding protein
MKYLLMFFLPLMLFAKEEVIIEVAGMHCPLCTTAVKKALSKVDGVEKVKVLLESRKATVWAKEGIEEKHYVDAVKTTGYTGVILSRQNVKD